MKYQKEFDEFRNLLLNDKSLGLDKEENEKIVDTLIKELMGSQDEFDRLIDIGVENGYSPEQQMDLVKKLVREGGVTPWLPAE